MKKILIAIGLTLASFSCFAQEGFSSVEERMTGKEFMETGLSKLSEQELAALNQWLRAHSVATLGEAVVTGSPNIPGTASAGSISSAPVTDRRGLEGKDVDRTHIESQLVGEFTGWDGETVFKLANGMVWKQDETDKYFTKTLVNPMVTIKPGLWSAWRLSVEGYNKSVQVKRIQ